MSARAVWGSIAAVAAVNLALVGGVWWLMQPAAAPPPAPVVAARVDPAAAGPPPAAVQRLAELISNVAFRSVITHDYAALSDLVKRAALWPEVAYLSVHDAQGKVIAQTDPARGGATPSGDAGRDKAEGADPVQEVTAAVAGPEASGKPGPAVGEVRLGYRAAPSPRAAAPPAATVVPEPSGPAVPLAAMLAIAGLVALPVGAGLARLAGGDAGASDVFPADLRRVRNLNQAKRIAVHWMREADVVREQIAVRTAELQRVKAELATARTEHFATAGDVLASERGQWHEERDRLHAEVHKRQLELEDASNALREQALEAKRRREQRDLLETELSDLREEVTEARAALAGRGTASPEVLEQELRQRQYRVIAYIARTIRSSLTNVLGYSKLLLRPEEGPLSEEQRASVESILGSGSHLLQVAKDLSDLAQVEAQTAGPFDEIVDVAAVLREAAAIDASGPDRPTDVILDCPDALPPVRGHRRRLGEVVLALLRAPAASDADGAVEVAARADAERLTLVVAHRSAAIPAQDLPALFEPFSPIDPTSALQDDGRRLRLALAKAVLTAMGGQLAVDAAEGRGTTFTATLPVHVDVAAAVA